MGRTRRAPGWTTVGGLRGRNSDCGHTRIALPAGEIAIPVHENPTMPDATAALQELDAAHHLHPFTDTATLNATGVRVITGADGVWLHDSENNHYLDAMSGLWCVNLGYGRSEIADAVARQLRKLPYYNTFFATTHPPAVELASTLGALAPAGCRRVFFTSSGSEAVDTAYRIARHYWNTRGQPERKILVSRDRAYHGTTIAGAAITDMPGMVEQGGDVVAPAIRRIAAPYTYPEGPDCDAAAFGLEAARTLQQLIDEVGADRIAAFIGEPVQGAGGVIIPPATYWPELQRICRKHDILLIADEVICGFGRTGAWFGSQYFDLQPDLMTIAKGLSSGYLPVGGVLVGDRVGDVISTTGGEFAHGHTYSGHPVCCAAALENLRLLREEGIVERVATEVVPAFRERWLSLGEHPLVGEARSLGLLGAIELSPDPATHAPFPGQPGRAGLRCRERCFANGLVMRSVRDSMVVAPPLVISEGELDQFRDRAWTALDETLAALQADPPD